MDGKKRGRRSGSSRASEAAPKMRKSCNACALAKRKCDGASCCSLCMKRGSRCIYSERQKSGPKGAKGDEGGSSEVVEPNPVSISPRSHYQRARASPTASVVAPITKRGRKAYEGTGMSQGRSYEDCRPPTSPGRTEVAQNGTKEVTSATSSLVALSSKKTAEEVTASEQTRQVRTESTAGGAASGGHLLLPATTRQQFTRATPATPSPPRQLPPSVLQGSPRRFALPATGVEMPPSSTASSVDTEVLPWTATRVRPSSTDPVTQLPCVPSSSSDENRDPDEVQLQNVGDMRSFGERILGGYEFPSDALETRMLADTDRVSRLLDYNSDYGDDGNTSNNTRKVVSRIQRVHDDVKRGQLQGVIVDPQQLVAASGEVHESLVPSPRAVPQLHQEPYQHQWVCHQPRPLSPSVVSSGESGSIRDGPHAMDISPRRSGCEAGRPVTSSDELLLGNSELNNSAFLSGGVEGTMVSADERIAGDRMNGTHFNGSSSAGRNGVEVFSGISAEAAIATLVEVMGGPGNNSNHLLSFEDEMHQRRQQHQNLCVQLPAGVIGEGGARVGRGTSARERASWQSQSQPQPLGPQHVRATPALSAWVAFPSDATVGMPVTMIPPVSRPRHPVPEDVQQPPQQRHHDADPLGMVETIPALSKGMRFGGASGRYLATF